MLHCESNPVSKLERSFSLPNFVVVLKCCQNCAPLHTHKFARWTVRGMILPDTAAWVGNGQGQYSTVGFGAFKKARMGFEHV